MTVTLTDGPLGLEAAHRFTGPYADVLLNDLSLTDARLKLDRMPNFRGRPDSEDARADLNERVGEVPFRSMARGKTFTVEGRIQASSIRTVRQVEWALAAALNSDTGQEGEWKIEPDPAYDASGGYWFAHARCIDYQPPDDEVNFDPGSVLPWEAPFNAGFRMSDPRFYWSDAVDTGNVTGTQIVTNQGNAPTEPTLIVTIAPDAGAVDTTIDVYNDTVGASLSLYYPQAAGLVGYTFTFNFQLRAIGGLPTGGTYPDDVADFSAYLSESPYGVSPSWWADGRPGLRPGANSIRAQIGGVDTPLRAVFYHAAWG